MLYSLKKCYIMKREERNLQDNLAHRNTSIDICITSNTMGNPFGSVLISLQVYGLIIPRTMAAMIAIRISIPMHVHLRVFLCSLFAFTSWPTPEVTYSSAFPTCTIRFSFDYFYIFFAVIFIFQAKKLHAYKLQSNQIVSSSMLY